MKTEQHKNNIDNPESKNIPEPSISRLLKEDFGKKKKQLASFLTEQTQKLSPQHRKLFFLFTGMALVFTIIATSYYSLNQKSPFDFFNNERVMPLQPQPADSEEIVTPEEYQVITSFSKTLDSLQHHNLPAYEKLMNMHPGLRDSMSLLIRIYQSTH